jgi:hypothetical protein
MELSGQFQDPADLSLGKQPHLWGNSPKYPLYRRLGKSQSQSGRYEKDKEALALTENQTPIPRYINKNSSTLTLIRVIKQRRNKR